MRDNTKQTARAVRQAINDEETKAFDSIQTADALNHNIKEELKAKAYNEAKTSFIKEISSIIKDAVEKGKLYAIHVTNIYLLDGRWYCYMEEDEEGEKDKRLIKNVIADVFSELHYNKGYNILYDVDGGEVSFVISWTDSIPLFSNKKPVEG